MTVVQSQPRVRLKCVETASTTRSTNSETSSQYQPLQGVVIITLLILTSVLLRQRLSQLQLMALILVYVRKTNYFEKCESDEDVELQETATNTFSKSFLQRKWSIPKRRRRWLYAAWLLVKFPKQTTLFQFSLLYLPVQWWRFTSSGWEAKPHLSFNAVL